MALLKLRNMIMEMPEAEGLEDEVADVVEEQEQAPDGLEDRALNGVATLTRERSNISLRYVFVLVSTQVLLSSFRVRQAARARDGRTHGRPVPSGMPCDVSVWPSLKPQAHAVRCAAQPPS